MDGSILSFEKRRIFDVNALDESCNAVGLGVFAVAFSDAPRIVRGNSALLSFESVGFIHWLFGLGELDLASLRIERREVLNVSLESLPISV
jgi:hypothetical protein